jgi:predicted SnoaL-like aldol condensation-catalyzing enzyme
MSEEKDNAQFIHRWFEEVWNKGRMEAIEEMCLPDAIGHGQAQHNLDMGLVEFKQFARDLRTAFPDIRITIHETLAQGDKGSGSLERQDDPLRPLSRIRGDWP